MVRAWPLGGQRGQRHLDRRGGTRRDSSERVADAFAVGDVPVVFRAIFADGVPHGHRDVARAVRMMESPTTREASRVEFKAASDHLPRHQQIVSALAAQSGRGWDLLRMVRIAVHKLQGSRR